MKVLFSSVRFCTLMESRLSQPCQTLECVRLVSAITAYADTQRKHIDTAKKKSPYVSSSLIPVLCAET